MLADGKIGKKEYVGALNWKQKSNIFFSDYIDIVLLVSKF